MFCKWCGMESETSDVCSWCRKPFSVAAADVEAVPPSDEVSAEDAGMAGSPPTPATTDSSATSAVPVEPAEVVFDLGDAGGALDTPKPGPQVDESLFFVDEVPGASVPPDSGDGTVSEAEFDDDLNPLSFGGVMSTQVIAPSVAEFESEVPPAAEPVAPPASEPETPHASAAPVALPTVVAQVAPARIPVEPPHEVPPPAPAAPVEPPQDVAPPIMPPASATAKSPGAPTPPPLALKRPTVPAPPVTPSVKPLSKDRVGPVYTPPAAIKPDDRPDLEAIPIRKPGSGQAPPPLIPISRSGKRAPAPALPVKKTAPPAAAAKQTPQPVGMLGAEPIAPPEHKPAPAKPVGGAIPLGDVEEVMPVLGGVRAPEHAARPLGDVEPEEDLPVGPIGLPANLTAPGAPVAPPPERVSTSNLPKAGGRTWYCRWCGMESDNPDKCSWCRKDLRHMPTVAHTVQPTNRNHSGSHGGKRKGGPAPAAVPSARSSSAPAAHRMDGSASPAAAAPSAPPATVGVPQMGTFQAQKSKYYQDMVIDPVSGAHYDADSGRSADGKPPVAPVVKDLALEERRDLLQQLGKYAGVLVAVMLVFAGLTAVAKPMYLLWIGLANLAGCIVLPVLRIVPFAEDDSDDIGLGVGLMLALGPVVGGIAYGVLCVVRSAFNPGVAAVFLVFVLTRLPIDLAVGNGVFYLFHNSMPWSKPETVDWATHLMGLWLTFAGLAGWYGAALFHKLDE